MKVIDNNTLVKFENLNRLFQSVQDNVNFCAQQESFKPGSGHFDYIYKLKKKGTQTIKSKFQYLEQPPVRYFETAPHSIGCAISKDSDEVVII